MHTMREGIIKNVKQEQIKRALEQIEFDDGVEVLYAVESGSRAWGFESPDSDYDVRFIYKRKIPQYLQIDPMRDVIEKPLTDELDLSGWDIFKAIRLFRSSNPSLMEWLNSPIIYKESGDAIDRLRGIAKEAFSARRCAYHYVGMARSNFSTYIADKDAVTLKKYLYVIRPLMCMRWLEKYGTPPPTLFSDVRAGVELASEIEEILEDLLAKKRGVKETEKSPPYLALNGYLQTEIERAQAACGVLPDGHMNSNVLNQWLSDVLNID